MYQKNIGLKWQQKENNVLKIGVSQRHQKNDPSVWELQ